MKSPAERAEINAKKGVLNPDQVLRIKEALAVGARPADLATLYQVSDQTITRIRDGKTWVWLQNLGDATPLISQEDEAGAAASLDKLRGMMVEAKASDKLIDKLVGDKP